MRIVEIEDRNPLLIEQLLGVWESSVKATHLFLSENEIEGIKKYVPQALNEIPHLIIVENENQVPMGFKVYKKTENDEQGNPYPLLYMSRK